MYQLAALYGDFLEQYKSLSGRASARSTAPLDAFPTYVPMLTQWRRLPYRDPRIPLALLRSGWIGVVAGQVFYTLHEALRPSADKHAPSVIHG